MNGRKDEKCDVTNRDEERNEDNIKEDKQYPYYVALRRFHATTFFFSGKAVSINIF
jgi:hypothetical protein